MAYVKNPERLANKDANSGYAGLDASGNVGTSHLGGLGGVAGATTFLRGDQTWALAGVAALAPVTNLTGPIVYNALLTDYAIFGNGTSGIVEVDLPDASANVGKTYVLKLVDSSANALHYVAAGINTIDGDASGNLTVLYDSITILADASGNGRWNIV